jgi:hypothetical protein
MQTLLRLVFFVALQSTFTVLCDLLFDMQSVSEMFNLPLRTEDLSVIMRMSHADTGTMIEDGGRRPILALLCVQEGEVISRSQDESHSLVGWYPLYEKNRNAWLRAISELSVEFADECSRVYTQETCHRRIWRESCDILQIPCMYILTQDLSIYDFQLTNGADLSVRDSPTWSRFTLGRAFIILPRSSTAYFILSSCTIFLCYRWA